MDNLRMRLAFMVLLLCSLFRPIAVAHAQTVSSYAPHFIYEIFTGSFADSNGDGSGDLAGVEQKLSYIKSLGADAIWLTPIFDSPSYHGYDVSDYEHIKSVYGDDQSFQKLVASAHAQGIKIILDIPVNHTSELHPWFKDESLYLWNKKPSFLPKQWYPLAGSNYFSSFSEEMPDLNWKNPDVLSRIESVFNYWTAKGVDGFRLDAAKYLIKGPNGEQNMPGTHTLWQKMVANVRKSAPNTYFVGEIWDDAKTIASYYGQGNELNAAFDFPVEGSLRSAISSGLSADFKNALATQLQTQKNDFFASPFAGNHDVDRLATAIHADPDGEKLAALAVFTLPGTPVVYYGDEIGMQNGNATLFPGDLAKRTAMDWPTETRAESDPTSLVNTYRFLAQTRAQSPALSSGTLADVVNLGTGAVAYSRMNVNANEAAIVVINFGSTALRNSAPTFSLPKNANIKNIASVYGNSSLTETRGSLLVPYLGPKQAAIFILSL